MTTEPARKRYNSLDEAFEARTVQAGECIIWTGASLQVGTWIRE